MSRRNKFIKVTPESLALKELRMQANVSLRKLADELNISFARAHQMESGRENVSEAYIEKFLKTLGLSDEDWKIAVRGGKGAQVLAQNKAAEDTLGKLRDLPNEKLKLLQSILSGLEL